MVIMTPGYFCDTAFPDRYMIDNYWPNYGFQSILRGTPSVTSRSATSEVL